MNNSLILEVSKNINHPTPLPIAKEIVEFCKTDRGEIEKVLERILKNEPWEYIRGYTYFLSNKIYLDHNVLIPRQETAEMVEIAKKEIGKSNLKPQIIDIGTGSGCIAIALSKILNQKIICTDISQKALNIAEKNVKMNKANVELIKADLLNFSIDQNKPTVIIANLPYIPTPQLENLENSVKKYEPLQALDGKNNNGTKHYTELLNNIKKKDINLEKAIFEIDTANIDELKKELSEYKYTFKKDQRNKNRFLIINPSVPK